MEPIQFQGVYTALVTPFHHHTDDVDWASYEKLVLRQIAGGVAGVVAVGTTGESPTLTKEEKKRCISEAIRLGKGKVQVIAGTGSNNTAESVEMTAWAKEAGADACLIVNPYYNRPSQAGLIAHVRAIAAVGLPVMLYNIPGRSGVMMTAATIVE
jgi:4-hydroxy-tetrahydrodipicolinate synthase